MMLIYSLVKISVSVEHDFKSFSQPLSSIHFHPPSYASIMTPVQVPPAPPAVPPSPAQPPGVQAPVRSKRSGCGASTTPRVFIPADAPPDASHSTPIVGTREIREGVQVEQTITSCRVPVPTALELPGRAVSDILRAQYPDSTGTYHHACHRDIDPQTPCLEMSLLNGGMWKDR